MSSPDSRTSPPSLEELTNHSAAALLFTAAANREVVVIVHEPSRSVALLGVSSDIDSFLSELSASKEGPPPASKSSIDSLPRVRLSEEEVFECPICLGECEGGDDVEVKEMPCKHRFHEGCIEKWLGMRATCPVCRFGMPVEEKKVSEMNVRVFFARGRGADSGSDDAVQDQDQEMERVD